MPYRVNKDSAKSPTIHDATCSWAQEQQKNPANGKWREFATYAEAWAWATQGQRTRRPEDCTKCNPLH
jgi:hypothetical protein